MPLKASTELHEVLLKWSKRFSSSETEQIALVNRTIRAAADNPDLLEGNLSRSLYRLMYMLAEKQSVSRPGARKRLDRVEFLTSDIRNPAGTADCSMRSPDRP